MAELYLHSPYGNAGTALPPYYICGGQIILGQLYCSRSLTPVSPLLSAIGLASPRLIGLGKTMGLLTCSFRVCPLALQAVNIPNYICIPWPQGLSTPTDRWPWICALCNFLCFINEISARSVTLTPLTHTSE
jgi:hypothetical protein